MIQISFQEAPSWSILSPTVIFLIMNNTSILYVSFQSIFTPQFNISQTIKETTQQVAYFRSSLCVTSTFGFTLSLFKSKDKFRSSLWLNKSLLLILSTFSAQQVCLFACAFTQLSDIWSASKLTNLLFGAYIIYHHSFGFWVLVSSHQH